MLSPGSRGLSPPGGNSTRPSARLMAITMTPVRRPMSASRSVWPASGLSTRIGMSFISMARLDLWVTSSTNSTAVGLVSSETMRWAPMTAGMITWLAPACRSFFWVVGCSARAMIRRSGESSRAVSVMKTLAASLGMAVTSMHARSIPAFSRTASSVASPTRCKNPRASISGTRFASSSMITNGSAELASPSQTKVPTRPKPATIVCPFCVSICLIMRCCPRYF